MYKILINCYCCNIYPHLSFNCRQNGSFSYRKVSYPCLDKKNHSFYLDSCEQSLACDRRVVHWRSQKSITEQDGAKVFPVEEGALHKCTYQFSIHIARLRIKHQKQ